MVHSGKIGTHLGAQENGVWLLWVVAFSMQLLTVMINFTKYCSKLQAPLLAGAELLCVAQKIGQKFSVCKELPTKRRSFLVVAVACALNAASISSLLNFIETQAFCFFFSCSGEYYLGYKKFDLKGVSWYNFLHPECIKEVQSKHRLSKNCQSHFINSQTQHRFFNSIAVTQSENDRSCILLLRLQKQDGSWMWVHTVLQVKENLEHSQSPVIVCTNQVLK